MGWNDRVVNDPQVYIDRLLESAGLYREEEQ